MNEREALDNLIKLANDIFQENEKARQLKEQIQETTQAELSAGSASTGGEIEEEG